MINDWVVAIAFLIVILVLVIIAIIIGFKHLHISLQDVKGMKWRRRRARALMLGNYQCAKCGAKRNLHVHHLSYDHFTKELDSELQVLCRKYHQEIHGRKF